MPYRTMLTALSALLISLATGCADDPIVGDWEGANEVVDVTVYIDADLTGEGEIFIAEDGGIECDLVVEITPRDDGEYKMKSEGRGGDECDFSVSTRCELDGDELTCEDVGDTGDLVLERI